MTLQPDNSYRLRMIKVSDIIGTPLPAISGNYVLVNICKNGRVVLVLGPNGIYTSDNYGDTWTKTNAPLEAWRQISSSKDNQYIYAIEYYGKLYRYHGNSWDIVNTTNLTMFRSSVNLKTSENGSILLITTFDYIYISNDYGNTWKYLHEINVTIPKMTLSSNGLQLFSCEYESDKILIGGFIIPTVTTSYSKNNNDLSNLFASYSSMSKAPNTGYKLSNGKDFSDIFDPILGNNKTTQTNYIASNGKDLCDIFSPK